MNIVNRKKFMRGFADAYGISYVQAKNETDRFWEYLCGLLREGHDITINNACSFKQFMTKPRRSYNPGTNDIITIPPIRKIKVALSQSAE